MKKKITKLFCILGLSTLLISNYTCTLYASHTNESEVQPAADEIQWIFKKENDKVYRRLYNFTTNQWIGDWILVD